VSRDFLRVVQVGLSQIFLLVSVVTIVTRVIAFRIREMRKRKGLSPLTLTDHAGVSCYFLIGKTGTWTCFDSLIGAQIFRSDAVTNKVHFLG
jgi:hypothetical protein